MTTVTYLGPEGTFTHQALERVRQPLTGVAATPLATVRDVLESVESGAADYGLIPIENSVEGEVASTVDLLIFGAEEARIVDEVVIPIGFNAFRSRQADDDVPKVALSHPHALGQCRGFLESLALEQRPATSTAEACRLVSASHDPALLAIASPKAGEIYGLQVYASDIGDVRDAQTRFYLLSKSGTDPTGDDKTTLVLTPPNDDVGILVRILEPFSRRGINLSGITSRPLKSRLGLYCFVVTCDAHIQEGQLRDTITELDNSGVHIKNLGSYPAWAESSHS